MEERPLLAAAGSSGDHDREDPGDDDGFAHAAAGGPSHGAAVRAWAARLGSLLRSRAFWCRLVLSVVAFLIVAVAALALANVRAFTLRGPRAVRSTDLVPGRALRPLAAIGGEASLGPEVSEVLYLAQADHLAPIAVACLVVRGPKAPAWLDIGLANHAAYCNAHGHDYALRRALYPDAGGRKATWHKLRFVQGLLDAYSAVMWTDADGVFTNCARSLQALMAARGPKSIYFAGDMNEAFNAGQFIARATPFAKGFLARAWAAYDRVPPCEGGKRNCSAVTWRYLCGQTAWPPGDNGAILLALAAGQHDCAYWYERGTVFQEDCDEVEAHLRPWTRLHAGCLPQSEMNSYTPYDGDKHPKATKAMINMKMHVPPAKRGDPALEDARRLRMAYIDAWRARRAEAGWRPGHLRFHAAGVAQSERGAVIEGTLKAAAKGGWLCPSVTAGAAPAGHR